MVFEDLANRWMGWDIIENKVKRKFEKLNYLDQEKHGLIGSFIENGSLRNDERIEIGFARLSKDFRAAPHKHTKSKTIVIVAEGKMIFRIEGEMAEVGRGEYLVFDQGVIEEVIRVMPGTQSFTIHTPSVIGGDKEKEDVVG